jgi:hypothetical protein
MADLEHFWRKTPLGPLGVNDGVRCQAMSSIAGWLRVCIHIQLVRVQVLLDSFERFMWYKLVWLY